MSATAEEDLTRLAEDVVAALTRAGLPARHPEWVSEESPGGGAKVWVVATADAGRGVYVTWSQHPELEVVVRRAVETLDLTAPELPFAAAALEAMRKALLAILGAAGFEVSDAPEISGAQALVRLPES
ncbi:hypothetical protein AB0368_09510 [Actinoplanes sp. NPDC051475]|uniref:hypothetical protein n=1 Tax=Actinoplanes sp. NPDC051475 TaxID=3157225 RepID=UPI00344FEB46